MFTNWVGNQTCTPARRVSPASEQEVQAAVREAIAAGRGVRVVATGHSFSPVHLTDGTMLTISPTWPGSRRSMPTGDA